VRLPVGAAHRFSRLDMVFSLLIGEQIVNLESRVNSQLSLRGRKLTHQDDLRGVALERVVDSVEFLDTRADPLRSVIYRSQQWGHICLQQTHGAELVGMHSSDDPGPRRRQLAQQNIGRFRRAYVGTPPHRYGA